MPKPNIVMVITHDTGRHLGPYGRRVDTPNMDRLSQEGVTFTNFFCTAPQCSPSRASFLTGRYPHQNGLIGLTHRGFRLNEGEKTLPMFLNEAGYDTYLFGFQHEAPNPKELGYQNVVKSKNNSCLNVTPALIQFLESKPEEPFFAMVGFSETHRPFPEYDGPVEDVEPLPYLPDTEEVRKDVAALNILVRRVDESVGKVLETLDRTDLRDNTLFIYTTDHGIAFPGAKATLLDPGVEIALLMRGPGGFEGGKKVEAMTVNTDFLPTVLDLCGIPIPDFVYGRSMLPLVRGDLEKLHDEIFLELTYHAAYDPMRAVRTERYKYIRSYEDRPFWFPPNVDNGLSKEIARSLGYFDTPRPSEMLFDLQDDPVERNNLVEDSDYEGVLEEMREKLDRWMIDTKDQMIQGYISPPPGARVTPPDSYNP
jgi:arylsulfatase A-like enzyme